MDPYKIEIPKKGRKWRVIEADKGPSSKGNLMHTIDVELINNPPVQVRNPETGEMEAVDINGLTIRYWLTLLMSTLDRVNQWRTCHGLPPFPKGVSLEELQADDPKQYIGKVGNGIVIGFKKINEDADGQPIINELTGKPMTVIDRKITDLMCPE